MKARIVLVLFIAVSLLSLIPTQRIFADEYEYDIRTSITINDNYQTSVKTIIDATDVKSSSVPTSFVLPAVGTSIKGVSAKFADGKQVPSQTNGNQIVLQLTQFKSNAGKDWSVSVSYTTDLGLKLGNSYLAMVSPNDYSKLSIASETVSITSSIDLGPFVLRGLSPNKTTALAGNTVTTWSSQDGPIEGALGLLFGDNALAKLSLSMTLQNDGLWWETKTLTLPADTNQQRVIIDSISPQPRAISLDVDGNIILEYRLGPRQKLDVSAEARAIVNSYTYSLDNAGPASAVPAEIAQIYTQLNDTWKDNGIEVKVKEDAPLSDSIRQIYDAVAKLPSQQVDPYEMSLEYANTLIGELRSHAVPSRLVLGKIFGDGSSTLAQATNHAWVEAYIPAVGWITLDPSFEKNGPYFGVADVQRVAITIRGENSDFPPEILASYSVSFLNDDIPDIGEMKPEVASVKYMVLPGIAMQVTTVKMPAGVILDGTNIKIGDGDINPLGSLAPLQKVQLRATSLLGDAFSSEVVKFGVAGVSGSLEDGTNLVETTSRVSYIPMIGLVVASVLFGITKYLAERFLTRFKNRKDAKKVKSSKERLVIATDDAGGDIEEDDLLKSPPRTEFEADNSEISTQEPSNEATKVVKLEPRMPQPLPQNKPSSVNSAINGDTIPLAKAGSLQPREVQQEVRRKRPPLIQ